MSGKAAKIMLTEKQEGMLRRIHGSTTALQRLVQALERIAQTIPMRPGHPAVLIRQRRIRLLFFLIASLVRSTTDTIHDDPSAGEVNGQIRHKNWLFAANSRTTRFEDAAVCDIGPAFRPSWT
jgi:hypothetical protein